MPAHVDALLQLTSLQESVYVASLETVGESLKSAVKGMSLFQLSVPLT